MPEADIKPTSGIYYQNLNLSRNGLQFLLPLFSSGRGISMLKPMLRGWSSK